MALMLSMVFIVLTELYNSSDAKEGREGRELLNDNNVHTIKMTKEGIW